MNWKKVKLGDYINVKTGKLDANVQVENGTYPFFTCSKDHLQIDTFSYDCECVLVAGNGDLNVKYYEGKFDAYQRTYIIESKAKNILDVRYLFHFMSKYVEKLRLDSIGGVIKYIKIGNITDAKIPLPDLATQKHIAEVLDKADALRQQNRQLLANYDELLQSTFIELFGDPVKNPKGWIKTVVNELAIKDGIKCGPFGTQLLAEEFQDSGVPLWGIRQVNKHFKIPTKEFLSEKKAKELKTYSILPFDIIMTRKGTIGNCAIYPKDYSFGIMHSDILRIRVDEEKCNPHFLCYQLRFSDDIIHQISLISSGAIMAGINVGKLKKILVLSPPLSLQQHFAKIVEQIEAQKAQAQAALAESEALFEGLLAGYFNA